MRDFELGCTGWAGYQRVRSIEQLDLARTGIYQIVKHAVLCVTAYSVYENEGLLCDSAGKFQR